MSASRVHQVFDTWQLVEEQYKQQQHYAQNNKEPSPHVYVCQAFVQDEYSSTIY